jgi:hypothetical protein
MIKECRSRGLDYGDARNAAELKELLIKDDA